MIWHVNYGNSVIETAISTELLMAVLGWCPQHCTWQLKQCTCFEKLLKCVNSLTNLTNFIKRIAFCKVLKIFFLLIMGTLNALKCIIQKFLAPTLNSKKHRNMLKKTNGYNTSFNFNQRFSVLL